jgi:hypothetical protein
MIRWTPTTPPLAPRRWQSRAEILKAHLESLSPLELLRVRPDLYALTWGWDFENKRYASGRLALYEEMERRAGFNLNQPRVPAGNPDGGQWTSEGGSGGLNDSRVISDAMPNNDWIPGAQYAQGPRGPRDRLPPLHLPNPKVGDGVGSTYRAGQVTIVNNAQTGISTVDETTEKLRTILEKVVNSRGEGYGPEYGTAIHKDFADAVRDENLRASDVPVSNARMVENLMIRTAQKIVSERISSCAMTSEIPSQYTTSRRGVPLCVRPEFRNFATKQTPA